MRRPSLYFVWVWMALGGGVLTTSFMSALYGFSAAPSVQIKNLRPDSLSLEAQEYKKGVGEVGDFKLSERETVDLWASIPGENMGASRPNRGLDMILRGPPGGTPNMITYNRA